MPSNSVNPNYKINDDNIIISVLLVTYNHEKFIQQSLNSVLAQELSFPWEVIVCDDCSTDRTGEILFDYERFSHVKITRNPTNIGLARNLANGLSQCSGKYIAMLEGDDYWTDSSKLAKQINFLDKNPTCAICCHAIRMVDDNGINIQHSQEPNLGVQIYNLEYLLAGNFIRNCSVVYRQIRIRPLPDWFFSLPTCDFPLHIFYCMYGDIGWLPEEMAIYRVHSNSMYSSKGILHDFLFREKFYPLVGDLLDIKHQDICRKQYFSAIYSQLAFHIQQQEQEQATAALFKLIGLQFFTFRIPFVLKGVVRYSLGLLKFWANRFGISL